MGIRSWHGSMVGVWQHGGMVVGAGHVVGSWHGVAAWDGSMGWHGMAWDGMGWHRMVVGARHAVPPQIDYASTN
jgi:hypothetical protein